MAVFREKDFWRHHLRVLVVAFLILSLSRSVGILGDLPAMRTIALQSLVMVLLALPLQAVGALLGIHYLGRRIPLGTASVLGCVTAAVPSTAIAMVLVWLLGLTPPQSGATRAHLLAWMGTGYPAALVLHATLGSLLWMVLSFPWWERQFARRASLPGVPAAEQDGAAGTGRAPRPPHAGQPDFLRRLSPRTRGTLWALSSERHYVRIRTDAGTELVLMRLGDAIDQCRHLDGIRIHRSHWVARAGMARVDRTGGKLLVVLRDGTVLPVSRSRAGAALDFAHRGRPPGA